MDDDDVSVRPRPGGRAARVVTAVHGATFQILDEVGYERLQLPQVAERAGVNRTTVYRRWPTKSDLVADVLSSLMRIEVPTPDTGSLQGDIEELLGEIALVLSGRAIRAVLRGVTDAAEGDAGVRAAQTAFWHERFTRSGVLVEHAIERGELPVGTDPRAVLEMAASPLYFRALFTGDEVSKDFIAEVARRAIRAFADDPRLA